MKRFIGSFGVVLLFLALMGCKKEDPNPELLDPIYADLERRASDSQKAWDDEVKKQVEINVSIERAEPRSLALKNAQKDLATSKGMVAALQQQLLYYQIRSKRRMLVDRITYKAAFAKNQPWPDPHEYSEYQVNIRLKEAPSDWNKRVPKLKDRVATATSKDQKPKEGGAKEAE